MDYKSNNNDYSSNNKADYVPVRYSSEKKTACMRGCHPCTGCR